MSCERRSVCLVKACKNIGIHLFPTDEAQKAQWMQAIEYFKPGLTVRKYSKICSEHFKPGDFLRTPLSLLQPGVAPKRLKRTAVPSIFAWKTSELVKPPSPCEEQDLMKVNITDNQRSYARIPPVAFVEVQQYLNISPNEFISEDPLKLSNEDIGIASDLCESHDDKATITEENATITEENTVEIDNDNVAEELEIASPEDKEILFQERQITNIEKHEKSVQTEDKGFFSINHIKSNDKAIHFYTGLENFDKLLFVYHTLGCGAKCLNFIYGKPKNLDSFDQFFLTLIILRRHMPFEEIAARFNVTIKQVYNIFITWVRFMALQWKNVNLWIDRESVTTYMPLDFYDKYPSTRVVLDATECPVKKPKLPFAQQVTFSTYKNRNTVKFLIGITPSGLISYVSPCYGGSTSDRQIIERSEILKKFDYHDEIMVDKGLNVQDIFIPYGVKVNMPSFFKKGHQIKPDTVKSNRKVASKRVHVERVIGLLKTYKILSQPLNQTETILSSDIVFICVMLVNFRSSIINKYAYVVILFQEDHCILC